MSLHSQLWLCAGDSPSATPDPSLVSMDQPLASSPASGQEEKASSIQANPKCKPNPTQPNTKPNHNLTQSQPKPNPRTNPNSATTQHQTQPNQHQTQPNTKPNPINPAATKPKPNSRCPCGPSATDVNHGRAAPRDSSGVTSNRHHCTISFFFV